LQEIYPLPLSQAALADYLQELEALRLVEPAGPGDPGRYCFRYRLTRHTLADSLLLQQRQHLQQALAGRQRLAKPANWRSNLA